MPRPQIFQNSHVRESRYRTRQVLAHAEVQILQRESHVSWARSTYLQVDEASYTRWDNTSQVIVRQIAEHHYGMLQKLQHAHTGSREPSDCRSSQESSLEAHLMPVRCDGRDIASHASAITHRPVTRLQSALHVTPYHVHTLAVEFHPSLPTPQQFQQQ